MTTLINNKNKRLIRRVESKVKHLLLKQVPLSLHILCDQDLDTFDFTIWHEMLMLSFYIFIKAPTFISDQKRSVRFFGILFLISQQ